MDYTIILASVVVFLGIIFLLVAMLLGAKAKLLPSGPVSLLINGGNNVEVNPTALQKILSHYWTHNVQELKAVLENSVNNGDGTTLSEADLEIGEKKAVSLITDEDNEGIRLMSLKEAEKLLIKKALIHTSENRTQAAKILGVSIRTLRNKINEYRGAGNAYFVNLR